MPESSLASAVQSLCPNIDIPSAAAEALGELALRTVVEIIKDAKTGALHGKRAAVDTNDINEMIVLRGFEPVYGVERCKSREWLWSSSDRSVFFGRDKELLTADVETMSLPNPPVDATASAHWLAVDGIQPDIPENAPVLRKRKKINDDGDDDREAKHTKKQGMRRARQGKSNR